MDFDDTPAEAEFRAEARAWLLANAPAKGSPEDFSTGAIERTMDPAEFLDRTKAWQRTLVEAGWAGITWPTEYGGRGGTAIQSVIWNQEASQFGVTVNAFAVGIGMTGPTLLRHGTKEQKDRYLPPMLDQYLPAAPGEYQLRSSGVTVIDPDYLSTWELHARQ